jgi:hypothetical protein
LDGEQHIPEFVCAHQLSLYLYPLFCPLLQDPTFSIFICLGDATLLLFMWGVSLGVWRRAGIDYITLLSLKDTELAHQFSHEPSLPEDTVMECTTDLSLVYLISFIVFNKAMRGAFSYHGDAAAGHAIPALLLAFYLYRFFFPWSSRLPYLKMLWAVIAAPFHPIQFRDGYIGIFYPAISLAMQSSPPPSLPLVVRDVYTGDLLTSLVRVSISLSFSLIYLTLTVYWWLSNHVHAAESVRTPTWQYSVPFRFVLLPFLTLFPLWVRLMQCLRRSAETGNRWPHYFNALKYTSAMLVFSFGVFRPHVQHKPLWIFFLICATCYQFLWDITMDWGLVRISRDWTVAIREDRAMWSNTVYITIVVANLILRFSWAVTLLPEDLQRSLRKQIFFLHLLIHLSLSSNTDTPLSTHIYLPISKPLWLLQRL